MAIATLIDGKAVSEQIKDDLADRIAMLQVQGIRPGLGTILVGDDPGSHATSQRNTATAGASV